jgi:hypothetical protein
MQTQTRGLTEKQRGVRMRISTVHPARGFRAEYKRAGCERQRVLQEDVLHENLSARGRGAAEAVQAGPQRLSQAVVLFGALPAKGLKQTRPDGNRMRTPFLSVRPRHGAMSFPCRSLLGLRLPSACLLRPNSSNTLPAI